MDAKQLLRALMTLSDFPTAKRMPADASRGLFTMEPSWSAALLNIYASPPFR